MRIGGIQKTSLIDYPNGLSTVLFSKGCNFRCPYCHNAELLEGEGEDLDQKQLLEELARRAHLIDAVVFSGGECTLTDDLYDLVVEVRKLGYLIKIDTNGTNPELLERLLKEGLVDYVAMDIKAPPERYEAVAGVPMDEAVINRSIELIRTHLKQYEFRTTVCQELLSREDLLAIAYWLKGSKRYVLQNFRDSKNVLAGKGCFHPYKESFLKSVRDEMKQWFEEVIIRL
ncbi:anaerobic ribonucleoside-triphosphate reductase activating protein [Anoxynatronum sibiricum]|uniref:Anaerobic ribonucleoside-triphosphate reductase activating protein n=1 Tax=Anoxynatronum sibiricum TaxID=210623 RepID=A0ABU9VXI3_9CLOT